MLASVVQKVDNASHRINHYSLIVPDVTAAMLVERTIAKKSFGNLTLLLLGCLWQTQSESVFNFVGFFVIFFRDFCAYFLRIERVVENA